VPETKVRELKLSSLDKEESSEGGRWFESNRNEVLFLSLARRNIKQEPWRT